MRLTCKIAFGVLPVLWGICLILCPSEMSGQIRLVPKDRLDSIANPKLSSLSSGLIFGKTVMDAGRINEDGGEKVYYYSFRNETGKILEIKRMTTNCSCVSAVCTPMQVHPEASATVRVVYRPEGHPGKFERRVLLYADYKENGVMRLEKAPAAILKLKVEVLPSNDLSGLYPYAKGSIRLRRDTVSFRKGTGGVEQLRFVNLGGKSLRLGCGEWTLPEFLRCTVTPETVQNREEGMITVEYIPESGKTGIFPIVLKGLDVPPSESAIYVKIEK